MQVFLKTEYIFGIRGMRDVDKRKISQVGSNNSQNTVQVVKWPNKIKLQHRKICRRSTQKFSKFGSRPKNFKVFRGRKNSKCSRPKNFKVFWGRKNFKVAWGQLIFQSPGGQVTSRPAKNFQSAESGQSVHVKWKSDPLSASWSDFP